MSSPTISRLFQPFRSKALELKNRVVIARNWIFWVSTLARSESGAA